MNVDFENIVPWNGANDTGRDVRLKWERNFAKIKNTLADIGLNFNTIDELFEVVAEELENRIRKDQEDSTEHLIKFFSGSEFGDFVADIASGRGASIDAAGNAIVQMLKSRGGAEFGQFIDNILTGKGAGIDAAGNAQVQSLKVRDDSFFQKDVRAGAYISDVFRNSTFTAGALGSGMRMHLDDNGQSYAEVDNLLVRREAVFNKLTIAEIKSVGGAILLSLADMTVTKVDVGATTWKCYFNNDKGSILNYFAAGDQAICRKFTGNNIKYYWALVTAVGADYIELSKTDKDGSGVPEAGDEIVQLGNRNDVGRQAAILLSAYGSGTPSMRQYAGINSYDLTGKEVTVISPEGNEFKGDLIVQSTGTNVSVIQSTADSALLTAGTAQGKADSAQITANQAKQDATNAVSAAGTAQSTADQAKQNAASVAAEVVVVRSEVQSNFTVLSGQISSKVSQTDFNALGQRVSSAESSINQLPGQITLAVTESKTYADNAVSNLQIGGRNLLRNSPSASSKITFTATTADSYRYFTDIYCELTSGVTYTISYKSDGEKKGTHTSGQGGVAVFLYNGTDHFFLGGGGKFTPTKSGKYWIRLNQYLVGDAYSFWDIKVELGNKPTDWTPAPEDVQSGIDTAQTTADQAKQNAAAAAAEVAVVRSEVQSNFTVLSGQISSKVSQTDFNALGQRVSSAESTINQLPNQITLAVTESKQFATAAVNAVQIGSVNLVNNSKQFRINGGQHLGSTYIPGQQYTISIENSVNVNPSANPGKAMFLYCPDVTPYPLGIHIPISESKQTYTFTYPASGKGNLTLCATESYTGVTDVIKLKVEKGNKATDWSPSPADVDTGITSAQTSANNAASAASTAQSTANAAKTDAALVRSELQSSVTVLSGQISLAVTETKTFTTEAVSNLKIGARNYLRDSRLNSLTGWYTSEGTAKLVTDSKFGTVVEWTRVTGSGNFQKTFAISDKTALANTDIVYFVIAKGNGSFYLGGWAETSTRLHSSGNKMDLGDGWFMYWVTFKSGATIASGVFGINSILGTWQFYAAGVLKGNKPADWSPAPEDLTAEAASLAAVAKDAAIADAAVKYTTKSEFSTSITQLSSSISLKASQTDVSALSSRVSSAEAKITPDAINLTVKSQAQSIANDASLVGRGQMLYRDPMFASGNNSTHVYNNLGNGTVTITRVSGVAGNPNTSGYCLKIVTKGSASPSWGGFNFGTSTKANRVLVTRIVAKIPEGRAIGWASNPTGNNTRQDWLTPREGTGRFTEYIHKLVCGPDGTFSTTAFFAISGGSTPSEASPLEWYVAFATVYDCTGVDNTPTWSEIESGINITQNKITIGTKILELTGAVTFNSLATDAQSKITTAQSTADTAKQNAASATSAAGAAQTTANSAVGAVNTLSANALQNKGTIPIADWNTITAMGIYSVPGGTASQQANFPGGAYPYGQLRVEALGNIVTQTYTTHNLTGMYIRSKYNAADWQPWRQIEDSATAQQRANVARDNVALRLGYANYADMEAKAVAGQTIINGGYIRTSLIKADEVITNQLLANKISATDITTGRITVTVGAKIGDFSVEYGRMRAASGSDEMILSPSLIRFKESSQNSTMTIGGDVFPAPMGGGMSGPCSIEVTRATSSFGYGNIGIYINVTGSTSYDDTGAQYTGNHALYIPKGDICGFRLRTRRVSSSQTLTNMDSVILTVSASATTLTLPTSPEEGHMLFIRKMSPGNVTLNGRMAGTNGALFTSWTMTHGHLVILIYDRVNNIWTTNKVDQVN